MSGPREDFLDGLTYQVKEEVVRRYIRERRILEEEKQEYKDALKAYQDIEIQVMELRNDLACLLVTTDNYSSFWQSLGFESPPLSRLGPAESDRPPYCPLGLSPRGLTQKGKYVGLVMAVYERFYQKAAEGREAAEGLLALANEINEDIKRFQANYDLLGIIQFLRSLDVSMLVKKKFLGVNFTAKEVGALEENLAIKPISPKREGIRVWPELPPPKDVERLAGPFLREIFKSERNALVPALNGKNERGDEK
jgi:hypothetical protein